MSDLMDLRFHVGALGFADAEKKTGALEAIRTILQVIGECLAEYNVPAYGFNGKSAVIDLYADTRLSGGIWTNVLAKDSITLNCIDTGWGQDATELLKSADTVTSFDNTRGYSDANGTAIEWIVAQSDIVLWLQNDEEQSFKEVIQSRLSSRLVHTSCISIDAKSPAIIQHMGHYCSEPISFEELKTFIRSLYPCQACPTSRTKQNTFFLSHLWHGCYQHFIRKYNAGVVYEQRPPETFTGQRKQLEDQFHRFDEEANGVAKQYREAIYFRSILPFLSTVFLAVGFYSEMLLGTIYQFGGRFSDVWMVFAGAGFLFNAIISAYAYFMYRNKSINQSHTEFLTSRYIAEFLRVAKLYHTQGVPVSPYFVSERARMAQARNVLRVLTPQNHVIDTVNTHSIVNETLVWIDGQIQYHLRTKRRLEKIVVRLKKFQETVFWIGFGLVLARGLLQFLIPLFPNAINDNLNGVPLENFLRSFANMLALMIPAWAGYFTSKLSLNNFSGLFEHSEQMERKLRALQHRVENLSAKPSISYESLIALSADVLSMQISEVDDWYEQTAARTIQRM
jgi:hypothetical protein